MLVVVAVVVAVVVVLVTAIVVVVVVVSSGRCSANGYLSLLQVLFLQWLCSFIFGTQHSMLEIEVHWVPVSVSSCATV